MGSTRSGGWRQWTEREARAVLAELAAWRGTLAEFVRAKGVSRRRIEYWRARLGPAKPPSFVAVRLPEARRATEEIAIRVDGIAVCVREDFDIEQLARIVGALARRPRAC